MTNYDKVAKQMILRNLEESGRNKDLEIKVEGGKRIFRIIPLKSEWADGGLHYDFLPTREIVIGKDDVHSENFTLKAFFMGLREFVFVSPKWANPVWAELEIDFASEGRLGVHLHMDGNEHSFYIFANPNPSGYGFEFVMPDGIPENVVA